MQIILFLYLYLSNSEIKIPTFLRNLSLYDSLQISNLTQDWFLTCKLVPWTFEMFLCRSFYSSTWIYQIVKEKSQLFCAIKRYATKTNNLTSLKIGFSLVN